jgi:hypothetical protein
MRNMKFTAVLFASLFLVTVAKSDLYWLNSVAILDFDGNPVAADQFDPTISAFAQLIFVGANSVIDSFVASGTGVTGDDVIIATMHAGQNDFAFSAGFFPEQAFPAVSGPSSTGNYYVRVFETPTPNFAAGIAANVPTTGYYWESAIITFTYVPPPDVNQAIDFAPFGGQTLTLVPEPGVLAMMGLGLFGLATVRRRLQS